MRKDQVAAVVGAFGFENVGDDAMLASWVTRLSAARPDLHIIAIGGNPELIAARYHVEAVLWSDWVRITDLASSVGLFIIGGGSLFHDYWAMSPQTFLSHEAAGPMYYLSMVYLAKLVDAACLLGGVGVGPLITQTGREWVRGAFELADRVTLRDQGSLRLLREIGVEREDLVVAADPVFALPPQRFTATDLPALPHPQIGVVLRTWPHPEAPWEGEVAAALDEVVTATGGSVLLMPFQGGAGHSATDDVAAAERVRARLSDATTAVILPFTGDPGLAEVRLAACDVLVGMRLHSLVMGLRAGIPVVGLEYDPKVRHLLAAAGLEEALLPLNTTHTALAAGILRALAEAPARRRRQTTFVDAATREAGTSVRVALDLLAKGPRRHLQADERLRSWGYYLLRRSSALVAENARLFAVTEADKAREEGLRAELAAAHAQVSELARENTRLFTMIEADKAREEGLRAELAAVTEADKAREEGLRAELAAAHAKVGELARENWRLFTMIEADKVRKLITRVRHVRQRVTAHVTHPATALRSAARRTRVWTRRAIGALTARVATREEEVTALREQRRRLSSPAPAPDPPSAPHKAPYSATVAAVGWPRPARTRKGGPRVAIVTPAFFDLSGKRPYRGGAERYLIELVRLLRTLGVEPEVYQPAVGDWVRFCGDIQVRGFDVAGDVPRANEVFHARVKPPDLTVYLGFFLAQPRTFSPSIGVSHGIYWDVDHFQATPAAAQEEVKRILTCFANLDRVISVDTNTINWVRATRIGLVERFSYVPNFVDTSLFRPRSTPASDRIGVLFPRRLCRARGFWLLADVLPDLLAEHPRLDIHIIGQPDTDREETAVRDLVTAHPGRVRWDDLPPEAMPRAYAEGDITLVPTVTQEGTSLSCLEAMASGHAVVATHVGGLSDLVIDRLNGLLIAPTAPALKAAVGELVDQDGLRSALGQRARETAETFSLDRWRERWRTVLKPVLGSPAKRPVRPPAVAIVENPDYIEWKRMRQRPHYLAERLADFGMMVLWRNREVPYSQDFEDAVQLVPLESPLHPRFPVVLIYFPYFEDWLADYDDPIVVYDVLDDPSIYAEYDRGRRMPADRLAVDYHRRLLERADVVIASATTLLTEIRGRRPDALYVPNGVDLALFDPARPHPVPEDLAPVPRPRISFHGSIASWVDIDLLQQVASAHPEWSFVFIGPQADQQAAKRLSMPNCFLLGEKPSQRVPDYLAHVQVGLVPFRMNRLTRGVRPLKALEYLAMGKRVVATPLPTIAGWPGVGCEEGAESFGEAIATALAAPPIQSDPALKPFLTANSWDAAARPLAYRIARLLARRRAGLPRQPTRVPSSSEARGY